MLPAAALCCTSEPCPATTQSWSLPRCVSSYSPPSSFLSSTLETHSNPHTTSSHSNMSTTRSTRKRKQDDEELVELPEDSDAESEEEYVDSSHITLIVRAIAHF